MSNSPGNEIGENQIANRQSVQLEKEWLEYPWNTLMNDGRMTMAIGIYPQRWTPQVIMWFTLVFDQICAVTTLVIVPGVFQFSEGEKMMILGGIALTLYSIPITIITTILYKNFEELLKPQEVRSSADLVGHQKLYHYYSIYRSIQAAFMIGLTFTAWTLWFLNWKSDHDYYEHRSEFAYKRGYYYYPLTNEKVIGSVAEEAAMSGFRCIECGAACCAAFYFAYCGAMAEFAKAKLRLNHKAIQFRNYIDEEKLERQVQASNKIRTSKQHKRDSEHKLNPQEYINKIDHHINLNNQYLGRIPEKRGTEVDRKDSLPLEIQDVNPNNEIQMGKMMIIPKGSQKHIPKP